MTPTLALLIGLVCNLLAGILTLNMISWGAFSE